MKKELLYTIPSLYRDDFRIHGYRFGEGKKALCIVGSMRGNEYQQLYICFRLVSVLKKLEAENALDKSRQVLVIPSLNPSSMNVEKRFWPTDNTDINRMFPGYRLGETTQRVAAGIFDVINTYENGIQFASFYMPGNFSPHVRMMKTGYENVEKARTFGLPYIVLRIPRPYDTTTLNYNWQIWNTDAFSLYSTVTDTIDEESAREMIRSVLRFMKFLGILQTDMPSLSSETVSRVVTDREFLTLRPKVSGIFRGFVQVSQQVKKGDLLAVITDSCEGEVLEEIRSPVPGILFFAHNKPLVFADTAVFKLLPL